MNTMGSSLRVRVEDSLRQAVVTTFPDTFGMDFDASIVEVGYPPDEKLGDLSSNAALLLAARLKKNPMEIARMIADCFSCSDIDSVTVVPPGYINFFVKTSSWQKVLAHILEKRASYGNSDLGREKKVMVEFISSNPTGPIHLGNARGGPAGDTLANVLEKAGYQVSREFYVNDFGNQVMILGHSVLGDAEAQYSGSYIQDLNRELPENMTDAFEVGRWAARKILDDFLLPACDRAGIRYDRWFSEASLHEDGSVSAMLSLLRNRGLAYGKDEAVWFRSTEFGDDKDRVLVKSDGKNTYLLADFAYHKNKIDRGYDKLITFLGADHHSEAIVMKNFVSKVLNRSCVLDIVLTQMVRVMKDGEEVKMSKRKGTYYALDDLIEEVGRDAVRFIFVSYASVSHIQFNINAAIEQSEKNPVYYVQYAHARMCSVLRKASEAGLAISEKNLDLLTHEKELTLLRELEKFPELVEKVVKTYETHRLPRYAISLADAFHSWYDMCRVIDVQNTDLSGARMALVEAVRIVLSETLRLIGVSAPERMEKKLTEE